MFCKFVAMYLPRFTTLFASGLITSLLTSVTGAWEFDVPCLQIYQPSDYTANATVSFTLIDVSDNKTTTTCITSFYDPTANSTNYPTGGSPIACTNDAFGWYFSTFTGLGDFSINIIHSYIDPVVGPYPETVFGTGNPINEQTVPALNCYVLQTGAYGCVFENAAAPIVIPVTGAVAKQRAKRAAGVRRAMRPKVWWG
ncbi:hypothetical protein MMC19_005062 [Ptychographa xylographoides]|nr:hypothetical protein [Ptychographa xylographoides]